ncbi:MAG: hypothetical protein HC854_13470 [Flavobacterium sp.]|nr:hypothetical protein [Flavobacterium sp.]
MKKSIFLLVIFLSLFLIKCSGSDTYRGSWKATNSSGAKYDIVFEAKKFIVKNDSGESKEYEYTQNSIAIENSVSTYGIKLGDGRGYQIKFPNSSDESVGLLLDENGSLLYTISRKDYINYEDIYKLE